MRLELAYSCQTKLSNIAFELIYANVPILGHLKNDQDFVENGFPDHAKFENYMCFLKILQTLGALLSLNIALRHLKPAPMHS